MLYEVITLIEHLLVKTVEIVGILLIRIRFVVHHHFIVREDAAKASRLSDLVYHFEFVTRQCIKLRKSYNFV